MLIKCRPHEMTGDFTVIFLFFSYVGPVNGTGFNQIVDIKIHSE